MLFREWKGIRRLDLMVLLLFFGKSHGVKLEIMELFQEFFQHKSFSWSLNTTFLVPIPKNGGAGDLRDFRPINFLGRLAASTRFLLRFGKPFQKSGWPISFRGSKCLCEMASNH